MPEEGVPLSQESKILTRDQVSLFTPLDIVPVDQQNRWDVYGSGRQQDPTNRWRGKFSLSADAL